MVGRLLKCDKVNPLLTCPINSLVITQSYGPLEPPAIKLKTSKVVENQNLPNTEENARATFAHRQFALRQSVTFIGYSVQTGDRVFWLIFVVSFEQRVAFNIL